MCDYGAVSSILDNLSEEALQDYYNYDYLDYGTLNLGEEPSGRMVYVRSGWGDGNYDVYKWVTDVGIVGVESVFIDPDEDYMFEDAEEYDILPSSDRSKIRDIQ